MQDDEGYEPHMWPDYELWEHQGRRLTVAGLQQCLVRLDPDLPVHVVRYAASGLESLAVVEIGLVGDGPQPDALVITVAPLD